MGEEERKELSRLLVRWVRKSGSGVEVGEVMVEEPVPEFECCGRSYILFIVYIGDYTFLGGCISYARGAVKY